MNKIPVNLIEADKEGDIVSKNGQLMVEQSPANITELAGSYDSIQGVLTIEIPNIGKLQIGGLPTMNSSVSVTTVHGTAGRDGVDGTFAVDGERGPDGCIGQQGMEGEQGRQGYRGQQGRQGQQGVEGNKGEKGDDGSMKIYFQATDPGAVGPGSIWVRDV